MKIYVLAALIFSTTFVNASDGIDIRMFDGFLTIPDKYYLDYKEPKAIFRSENSFGRSIEIGEYSEKFDITTRLGAEYFESYKLIKETKNNNLTINVMVPKASIDINDTFYLVMIHNYLEYILVASDNLSIYKSVVDSYKVIDRVEYVNKNSHE